MKVKSDYAISIAIPRDWLKNLRPVIARNSNCSPRFLLLLRLVGVITFVLAFLRSFENCSCP